MSKRELHLRRLQNGLAKIEEFRGRDAKKTDPEFDAWRHEMIQSLDAVLPDENYSIRLANMSFRDHVSAYSDYIPDHQKVRANGLRGAEILLQSALEEAALGAELHDSSETRLFVDQSRIAALSAKTPPSFDLLRLVRMCEELNVCYRDECYLAVAMLTRAILDHVPPLFGKTSFSEVASNYSGGKSFSVSMHHLEKSARNIADSHLHQHIRSKEILPTRVQVSFQHDLDVLLGEIVRIL